MLIKKCCPLTRIVQTGGLNAYIQEVRSAAARDADGLHFCVVGARETAGFYIWRWRLKAV